MTIGTSGRALALLLAGGLLAVSAACGNSSAAGDAASGGGGDSGSGTGDPMTHVTVAVTGDVTAKGTSTALPATHSGTSWTSCGQYAKGETRDTGDKYFVLPENLDDRIDGRQVHVGAEIENYTGPATYGLDQLTDVGGGAGLGFDGKQYFIGEGSTAKVTITSDGGGTWDFTGLVVQNDNNTQSGGKLSGSLTWTCKNG